MFLNSLLTQLALIQICTMLKTSCTLFLSSSSILSIIPRGWESSLKQKLLKWKRQLWSPKFTYKSEIQSCSDLRFTFNIPDRLNWFFWYCYNISKAITFKNLKSSYFWKIRYEIEVQNDRKIDNCQIFLNVASVWEEIFFILPASTSCSGLEPKEK